MHSYKTVIKRSAILISVLCCIAFLCACTAGGSGRSSRSLTINSHDDSGHGDINEPDACCVYIRETFGLDLFDYCRYARMELNDSEPDEYAEIRFEVKSGKAEELEDYLKEKLGNGEEYTNDGIPGYQDHEYALEMKTMEPVRHFVKFQQGVVIKSRGTNFYLAKNGDEAYLFIFG